MNKSVFNGLLVVCLLGLAACGDNSKSKSNSDSGPGITLSGEYKVGIRCIDDAAQAKLEKTESNITFKEDGTYSMTFKLVEGCNDGCTYNSTGTYKLTETSLIINQTYQLDVDRNEESRQTFKMSMIVQGIDKDQSKIVALHESKTNMCAGQAVMGFRKVK